MGGTAIKRVKAETGADSRPLVDETEADWGVAGAGLNLAARLVACFAIALALMAAALALFAPATPVAWVAANFGTFGAALGGVKLMAMAWGLGSRLWGGHPASVAAAYGD